MNTGLYLRQGGQKVGEKTEFSRASIGYRNKK